MLARVPKLFLLGALLALGSAPAQANRITALVVSNSVAEAPASAGVLPKTGEFEKNLFSYGNDRVSDAVIMSGRNLTKEKLVQRLAAFTERLEGSELVLFVYVGAAAHGADGSAYLVPSDWDGKSEAGLVPLRDLLASIRTKGRGLVFIDGLEMPAAKWTATSVRPGLGASLKAEAAPDRLQIAALDVKVGKSAPAALIADVLARQIGKDDVLKLPKLASLVKDEVTFETRRFPLVLGSVSGQLDLKRLGQKEQREKAMRCQSARGEPSATNAFADLDLGTRQAEVQNGQPGGVKLAAQGGTPVASGRWGWWWYCPDVEEVARVEEKPSFRPAQPTYRAPAQPAPQPRAPAYRGGPGGGPGGGGGSWVPGG